MRSSFTVVGGIRGFSPAREEWVTKPDDALPSQVTVTFRDGQTGHLDMTNPRAVHWARVIEERDRAGEPVYVEIDEETNVITNFLIPTVCKVEALEPDDAGDIRVRLAPSAAVHLLLKSNPDFDAMRTELQSAMDNDQYLQVTETRDEHEIIDIRRPESPPGGSSGPPPTPPTDPPVSEARAQGLFGKYNGMSCVPCSPSSDCIPFKYPDNGCWARAHKMCHDLVSDESEDPEKVWIRGNLVTPTPNHPDCVVSWWYHVAPILTVATSSGNEKWVIDPSVSPSAESEAAWKGRQGDPTASLTRTVWTQYGPYGGTDPSLSDTNSVLATYRSLLRDRCMELGPPPYYCIKNLFFIIDRNTFSDDEIEAMLHIGSPATIEAAFYVVLDGFSPEELGFTSATMQLTPSLSLSPSVSGMSVTVDRLEFEYPSHLKRRQRLTWVYKIEFTHTSGFTASRLTVTMDASVSSESATGYLYLIQQPNPYELDGETAWLSTDLRVFQISQGGSKFNATMGSDPSAFIKSVIANLNSGTTGGQTFETDLELVHHDCPLELSQTVGGTPVYNFAVAKVRYRSRYVDATDVRVFFRLFPVATTSLEYTQATTYRRHEQAGRIVPLLGVRSGQTVVIPCFAESRVDSLSASMTTQTDPANVQTVPLDSSGNEVVQYFGCWLDINQTQPQFPLNPSPADGPWSSDRKTIQEMIRNEHQCLVSEIAFSPAPAQNGSTPSTSDKLAQRNLAIVESANPGTPASRKIPQTFEIRASTTKVGHDELMIDWGNVPAGSHATIYVPGLDTNDILLLAARKYRAHRLARIDEHTLKCDTGGITYIPIPETDVNLAGLLTVNLPEGIEKGQAFTVVVRQVTGEQWRLVEASEGGGYKPNIRRIVGSFQLTMPVREKAQILPRQERLLSNLRWIETAIPKADRWAGTFSKYVALIADRVDALGGDSSRVAATPTGQWEQARRRCLFLSWAAALLVALLAIGSGILSGGWVAAADVPTVALLIWATYYWLRSCRPSWCKRLRSLLIGLAIGTIVLAILAIVGMTSGQLIATLVVAAILTVITLVICLVRRCF
jgi:hypothetical protein